VVDAGLRKDLDLRVVSPVEHFGPLPEKSVWPSIYRLLAEEVRQHRSTIIFAHNRRTVERITAHLNESGIRDQESGVRSQGSGVRDQESGVKTEADGASLTPASCLLIPVP
jgi:Lhr-like helicase